MGGLGYGATRWGSSWGLEPRGRSDPDPQGDKNTRIGAAPAAPENINITTTQQLPGTRFFDLLYFLLLSNTPTCFFSSPDALLALFLHKYILDSEAPPTRMAPLRRVPRRQTQNAPLIQGGIQRSRRERQNTARSTAENATTLEQRARSPPPAITLGSEVSELSSGTLSSKSPQSPLEPALEPEARTQPESLDLPTLNNILQQREDQFLDRILTHLAGKQTMPHHHDRTGTAARGRARQPPPRQSRPTQGPEDETSDTHSMYSPQPIHDNDESASVAMDSVEAWFPGVERATLTQIIENRFKPTNIHRLLASEKDRAESQRVINIGGVCFEQGEREERESEYRMGHFFKAWAAYCGILTKLAPAGLQCDLACSLHI